ncbi:hypothetical protein BRADI_5g12287v3 [Brachypodium distachyon]|uniref:Uncharacterized protein n=1 Tax=Brachypodium distachyon TaxID=15368 RepID=A0A2K2CGR0_BRADI|nr:hypothetical protein BRADI_5g12287v3 [Brachypodium distachyon]
MSCVDEQLPRREASWTATADAVVLYCCSAIVRCRGTRVDTRCCRVRACHGDRS